MQKYILTLLILWVNFSPSLYAGGVPFYPNYDDYPFALSKSNLEILNKNSLIIPNNLTISSFTEEGFVKNSSSGLFSGGNTLEMVDLPLHADRHEFGGDDLVHHDDLSGYVWTEHIDWTGTTQNFVTTGSGSFGTLTVNGDLTIYDTVGGQDTLNFESISNTFIRANNGTGSIEIYYDNFLCAEINDSASIINTYTQINENFVSRDNVILCDAAGEYVKIQGGNTEGILQASGNFLYLNYNCYIDSVGTWHSLDTSKPCTILRIAAYTGDSNIVIKYHDGGEATFTPVSTFSFDNMEGCIDIIDGPIYQWGTTHRNVFESDINAEGGINVGTATGAAAGQIFTSGKIYIGTDGGGDTGNKIYSSDAGKYCGITSYGTNSQLFTVGANNYLDILSASYMKMRTGGGESFYFDCGAIFKWRDVDASNTQKMALYSDTGSLELNCAGTGTYQKFFIQNLSCGDDADRVGLNLRDGTDSLAYIWLDDNGDLRFKTSAPNTDTDGTQLN